MKSLSYLAVTIVLFTSLIACKNKTQDTEAVETAAPAREAKETVKVENETSKSADKYSTVLKWGEEEYEIVANPKGDQVEITITPNGGVADQEAWIQTVDGRVTHAEIGDLNGDNHAEVLVYTVSGANKIGSVVAVSSLSGKSIVQAYFPSMANKPNISQGYNGGDQFAIVETKLAHRFPLYENGELSGKTRQITYKVVEGEASRQFEVIQVDEY